MSGLFSFNIFDKKQTMMQKENFKPGGIIFMTTRTMDSLHVFYTKRIGAELWLDQGACRIYRFGNMLFGFCKGDEPSVDGVITFFYPSSEEVDEMYLRLKEQATTKVKTNEKFRIYHFYAEDPEGRSIEFQYFNHELKAF